MFRVGACVNLFFLAVYGAEGSLGSCEGKKNTQKISCMKQKEEREKSTELFGLYTTTKTSAMHLNNLVN